MTLASRIQSASVTGLSLVCAYALAFYWQLDRPFWAGFTVFMVSLPSIGQSLQKGLLRTVGTFLGAFFGVFLFILFPQERFLLLFFLSLYLSLLMYLMAGSRFYGYFFFITALVGMIIILVGAMHPESMFTLAVYRVEETLLGIAVYTFITLLVEPQLSLKTFVGNCETLLRAHQELFFLMHKQNSTVLASLYAKYGEVRELLNATELLLPAVKLENYQVYANRTYWRSALACSGELFEAQRQWTGTLVAMKSLRPETLFLDFNSAMQTLEHCFTQLSAMTPQPSSLPELHVTEAAFEGLSAAERSLVSTARTLYHQQIRLCRTLYNLFAYLLHGGERPSEVPVLQHKVIFFQPEQHKNMVQTFVLFWVTACIWMLFDPPGTESMVFMELTLVLGLSSLLTDSEPLHSVLYLVYGILITGVLYIFVYPFVTSFALFMTLLFGFAFALTFWCSHPDQRSLKFGLMLPWLAIGNFTNTPQYSFTLFMTSALTLLLGISLVSCIRYLLLSPDNDDVFIAKQDCFFRDAERMLSLICDYHGRAIPLFSGLYGTFLRYRIHFLAAQISGMVPKRTRSSMTQETARMLSMEITDIAGALHRLQSVLELPGKPFVFSRSEQMIPVFGLGDQAEVLRRMTDRMLVDLYTDSRMNLLQDNLEMGTRAEQLYRLEDACGSMIKALSGYGDAVRALS